MDNKKQNIINSLIIICFFVALILLVHIAFIGFGKKYLQDTSEKEYKDTSFLEESEFYDEDASFEAQFEPQIYGNITKAQITTDFSALGNDVPLGLYDSIFYALQNYYRYDVGEYNIYAIKDSIQEAGKKLTFYASVNNDSYIKIVYDDNDRNIDISPSDSWATGTGFTSRESSSGKIYDYGNVLKDIPSLDCAKLGLNFSKAIKDKTGIITENIVIDENSFEKTDKHISFDATCDDGQIVTLTYSRRSGKWKIEKKDIPEINESR